MFGRCAKGGEHPAEHPVQTARPLGQHLKRVPMRIPPDLRDPEDVLVRHGLMKEVAHRVDEDHSGRPPLQRLVQL